MAKEKVVKFRGDFKDVDKGLKNTSKGLTGIGKAGNLAGKGFKAMGTAMKAAGIGLLVSVMGMLFEAMQKNQKIMDTFSTIMLAVGEVLNSIVKVVEKVVGWFVSLGEAIFGASSAGDSLASSITKQRNAVKLMEADLEGLTLQYEIQAEQLRQIRDDESLSIADRIKANEDLGVVLEEQLEQEKIFAEERVYLAELELQMNKDNIDNQVALKEAKNQLLEIENRITGQRSEQLTNLNALERERQEAIKEAFEAQQQALREQEEQYESFVKAMKKDLNVEQESKALKDQLTRATNNYKEALNSLKTVQESEIKIQNNSITSSKNNEQAIRNEIQALKDQNEEIANSSGLQYLTRQTKKDIAEDFQSIVSIMTNSQADMCGELTDFQRLTRHFFEHGSGIQQLLTRTASTNRDTGNQIISDMEALGDIDIENMDRYLTDIQMILLNLADSGEDFKGQGLGQWLSAFEQMSDSAKDIIMKGGMFKDHEFKWEDFGVDPNSLTQDLEWYGEDLSELLEHFAHEYETLTRYGLNAVEKQGALEIEANNNIIKEKEKALDNGILTTKNKGTELSNLETDQYDERTKLFCEYQQILEDLEKQAQDQVNAFRRSEEQVEIDNLKKQYENIIMLTKEGSTDRIELEQELQDKIDEIKNRDVNSAIAKMKENQAIIDQFNMTEQEIEIQNLQNKYAVMEELAEGDAQVMAQIEEQKQIEIKRIQDKYNKMEENANKAKLMTQLDAVTGSLGGIKDLYEEGEKGYKAFATAENAMATAVGITKTLSAMPGPAGWLSAAVLLATGIKNQKAIMKGKKVEDTVGGGGGGGGDDSGDVPRNLPMGFANIDQQPVQAYVVENDISNAQALQNELDVQATL